MTRSAKPTAFRSDLKRWRQAAGLTQKQLAAQIGVTRQAVLKIEAGDFLPNTAIALRLARVLGCQVEELFGLDVLPIDAPIELVGGAASHRVLLARIGERLVGYPANSGGALAGGYSPADALLADDHIPELLVPADLLDRTAIILGCDPALSLVRAHLTRVSTACRVHTIPASSHDALAALRTGHAHVAGTHLVTPAGNPDLGPARTALRECGGRVVTFALWDQGLVLAPGNPRRIRDLADLTRPKVTFINRAPGSGSRILLDAALQREGIPAEKVAGYQDEVGSHLEVCQAVRLGLADAGVAVASLAEDAGLEFVPLGEVRFDLVIRADSENHPAVRGLLEVLEDRLFRRELGALPSYFVGKTGSVAAEVRTRT